MGLDERLPVGLERLGQSDIAPRIRKLQGATEATCASEVVPNALGCSGSKRKEVGVTGEERCERLAGERRRELAWEEALADEGRSRQHAPEATSCGTASKGGAELMGIRRPIGAGVRGELKSVRHSRTEIHTACRSAERSASSTSGTLDRTQRPKMQQTTLCRQVASWLCSQPRSREAA